MRPHLSTACCAASCCEVGSRTSATAQIASPPLARTRSTRSSELSIERSSKTIRAPVRANSTADAAPIPLRPPVIMPTGPVLISSFLRA